MAKLEKADDLQILGIPVPTPDTARACVKAFHDTHGLSYREIAQKPFYKGLSQSSLARFKKTGKMTKKMRKRWSRKRHRIAISKLDPASAARSIRENCYFGVDELIEELKCQT